MSSIGMMDGAFFVGRKEIVEWVNVTLQVNIDKIEDTASGAIACQLLDIMHPNVVPMSKINWSANKDFEYVANYKVLQTCFTKLHVDKHVDVDRLIKGKYQDNLEFMQWFKRFFEMTVSDIGDYDAVAQRSKGKGGAEYTGGKGGASKVAKASEVRRAPAPAAAKKPLAPSTVANKPATAPAARTTTTAPTKPASSATSRAPATAGKTPAASASTTTSSAAAEIASLKAANEALSKAHAEIKMEMDGLVTERDFYFDKLRDVEMMLQELEDAGKGTPLTAGIFKILYATADGFETQKVEGEEAAAGTGSIASPVKTTPAPVPVPVPVEEAPAAVEAAAPSEASAPEDLETF